MLTLSLPEGELPVRLTRRTRRSIGLKIKGGEIELIAPPQVPLARLQEILLQKRDWLRKHWLQQQAQRIEPAANLRQQMLWRGEVWPLQCQSAARWRIALQDGTVLVYGPSQDQAELAARLQQWQKQQAKVLIGERLALFAPRAARPLRSWALSSARTRWGSCSADGSIRLNWRLLQAPPAILDYVIVHELAHLLHMNHSAAFWAEVSRLYPDWQAARRWLKQHGNTLFALG